MSPINRWLPTGDFLTKQVAMRRESVLLPSATYVELVQGLFCTLPPTLIMSGLFVGIGVLAETRGADLLLAGLTVIGALLSIARIAAVVQGRAVAPRITDREEAQALERRFAITYVPFALVLGLFGARLYMLPDPALRTLAAVMVAGYAAGVANGIYVRPRICIWSIAIAVAPIVLVAGISDVVTDRLLALVLTLFTAGGISSVLTHYRSAADRISQHHRLSTLSRHDPLTSLPNRLALEEAFDGALKELVPGESVWMHCIDLDGVAAANDLYGQAAGDLLIKTAASRLSAVIGENGLPVRLTGVFFCVLHGRVRHAREPELLAKHIAIALSDPYTIDGRTITVTAHVGTARAGRKPSLAALMQDADEALQRAKRDEAEPRSSVAVG